MTWILTIVMLKPMQVTIVSAVPLYAGSAFCATMAENCGESDTTVIPQVSRKKMKTGKGAFTRKSERMQHRPEIARE